VNPELGVFDWAALDDQLRLADAQDQSFSIQVSPIGGATGNSVPPWLWSAGVPQVTDGTYLYGYYLDPAYQNYFGELVDALARHVREELPPHLQARVRFVRVDTGATGDEAPYEEPTQVPAEYQIPDADWRTFRLWVFERFREAFQEGVGPPIPLLFQDIESTGYPAEWEWVRTNVRGGFGAKYGGQVRGHHLTESQEVTDAFKRYAVDSDVRLFSRNEMDQTWSRPYFQLNLRMGMYWTAVEQLHAGLGIWDVTASCLERTYTDDFAFAFEFFNTWAAELDPATAAGGFSILHEGLDAADTVKFPVEVFGGPARLSNTSRYLAICAAYAAQGAQMDDVAAATRGQVAQRATQQGFNDAGWRIVPGNYERFITQLDPSGTSIGRWRLRGPLTASSHPYDRFARSFAHAMGRDTMSFDIDDALLASHAGPVTLSVDYLDAGSGQFALRYDATDDPEKTAFTVTKTNTNTWMRRSVVVTDGAFRNRGPGGADFALINVDADDDVFHGVEVTKVPIPCVP
jgi:hypothetical protein